MTRKPRIVPTPASSTSAKALKLPLSTRRRFTTRPLTSAKEGASCGECPEDDLAAVGLCSYDRCGIVTDCSSNEESPHSTSSRFSPATTTVAPLGDQPL